MSAKLNVGLAIAAVVLLSQNAWATPAVVPDGGSTSLLLLAALGGLGLIRPFLRRGKPSVTR